MITEELDSRHNRITGKSSDVSNYIFLTAFFFLITVIPSVFENSK